jgi:hypothetical protein
MKTIAKLLLVFVLTLGAISCSIESEPDKLTLSELEQIHYNIINPDNTKAEGSIRFCHGYNSNGEYTSIWENTSGDYTMISGGIITVTTDVTRTYSQSWCSEYGIL